MSEMYWLIILVVTLIIEIATLGLTTIWFAGGALVAFIAALCGADLGLQMVLFFVVSLALLFSTRPIAVKYLNKSRTKTNAESLIGKTAVVTRPIHNLKGEGTVMAAGQEWTARTQDDASFIEAEQLVTILAINGVKLIVEQKKEDNKICR